MPEPRIYYLGPEGTFCHAAALSRFGTRAPLQGCQDIPSIFEALAQDSSAKAIVPIENTTEGTVNMTLDALLRYPDLTFVGEIIVPVEQCLLGLGSFETIDAVYSHPHGLAQCRGWLRAHLPAARLVSSGSTALAAQRVANIPTAAAIASELAGTYAGLSVLARGIQDGLNNKTRFIVLGHSRAPASGADKTSIVFGAPHERGALYRTLGIFEREGLNLTKIESRPMAGKNWQYVFFADLEGHRDEAPVGRALAQLERNGQLLQWLGSYPRALETAKCDDAVSPAVDG